MVKKKLLSVSASVLVLFTGILVISPAIILLLSSFGIGTEKIGFEGYAGFYVKEPIYIKAFLRSFLISASSSLGCILVSVPAAYVFAKVKFKGSGIILYIYIIVMMMPFQVTLLPQYIISKFYGTYDSPLAMILPGIFAPFSVFLLTQIMKSVPQEIIDSGRLETSSTLVIILKLIVPAIRPGIICTAVLVFTEQWNMVAEPLVLMESQTQYPLSVLLRYAGDGDVNILAAAMIFMIPPLLLFGFFREEINEGLGEYKLK
ncbi:MAG: carbohydrate ABC transporter permease [Ruminococcaceae bacterium]|nr:carbohydrate ABC transporter permease [Oscillospiraceae bacterium]